MSGHSKWHSIKHKKGANDKARGKVFTKHARLITLSAKNGADPLTNPGLRAAIDSAKADNVPNDNIDRAVKKGSGEGADAVQLHEITYEGYGPKGVALMIQVVTDNKNRSVANVRTIMTKNGGNLGESGSVGYMFSKRGYFLVECNKDQQDEVELNLIELGAEDIISYDNEIEVFCGPTAFFEFQNSIKEFKLTILDSRLSLFPINTVKVENAEDAQKIYNLIEKLEEDDDVMDVIGNFEIEDEI